MRRSSLKASLIALAFALVPAASAWAQSLPENGAPTRAGTEIRNVATVNFTDANNNSYDPVSAEVAVTVARITGVEITGETNKTVESPSTGNTTEYTVINRGNDFDTFNFDINAGSGITVTGFRLNDGTWIEAGTLQDMLAELNNQLANNSIDYSGNNGKEGVNDGVGTPNDSTLKITVRYDIAADFDPNEKVEVTVKSNDDPDGEGTDDHETGYTPTPVYSVVVDGDEATVSRLPSGPENSVTYTETFKVINNGSGSSFNWTVEVKDASNDNGAEIVVSGVTGTGVSGGPSSGSVTVANGDTVEVTITYTVDKDAAAGTTERIIFTVTSNDDANVQDGDETSVTVIRPALTITKEAFADQSGTPLTEIKPGETFWYRITVTNSDTHSANADQVEIEDVLPDALEFLSGEADAGNIGNWLVADSPNGLSTTVTARPVEADNSTARSMAPGESAIIWIQVRVR